MLCYGYVMVSIQKYFDTQASELKILLQSTTEKFKKSNHPKWNGVDVNRNISKQELMYKVIKNQVDLNGVNLQN